MTGFAAVSSMRRVNQSVDFSAVSAGAKQAAQKELILLKNNEAEAILHTIKEEEGWLTTAILFLTYILTYIINPVKVSRRDGINYVFNGQHTIEMWPLFPVPGIRRSGAWCMTAWAIPRRWTPLPNSRNS